MLAPWPYVHVHTIQLKGTDVYKPFDKYCIELPSAERVSENCFELLEHYNITMQKKIKIAIWVLTVFLKLNYIVKSILANLLFDSSIQGNRF